MQYTYQRSLGVNYITILSLITGRAIFGFSACDYCQQTVTPCYNVVISAWRPTWQCEYCFPLVQRVQSNDE